jgi:TPR repeat protein
VSDESELQIILKDDESSLILSSVRSSLVARGRRDAISFCRPSPADETDPLAELRRQAEEGDPDSQHHLGLRYALGSGLPLDYREATKWLSRAAEQNSPEAQFDLGVVYAQCANFPEAARWLRKSVDYRAKDFLVRLYGHGKVVPLDDTETQEWRDLRPDGLTGQTDPLAELRRRTEEGDADAQYQLGCRYRWNIVGVRWLRKAGEQGRADALGKLHFLYSSHEIDSHEHVTEARAEGIQWLSILAEAGNVYAKSVLGAAYAYGQGVQQDCAEAVRLWKEAAEAECHRDTEFLFYFYTDTQHLAYFFWKARQVCRAITGKP